MRRSRRRNAIALMWVLVVLSVLSVTATAATWQFFTARRILEARQHKLQAAWLARSASELAAAKLLKAENPAWSETVELIPDSRVTIVVEQSTENRDAYRIVCEVTYPLSQSHPISTKTIRLATKTNDGDGAKIELASLDR